MGLAFSRLWFGNHGFGEHATLQEFQHRFLISTLLIGVFCTAIYSLLTLGMNIPKAGWLRVYGILLAAVMLGLWAWLRIHPERFRSVACSSMALNFSVLVINTWLNPFDPLFFLWLFSTLLPAFVLLGRAAGWVVTVLAVACVGLANTFVHRHFSAVSMQTIVLTTFCLALQCHFYVARFQGFLARLNNYQAHLRQLAQFDPLTGVRNAAAYYAQCEQYIRVAQRARLGFAVLFADLDHFKQINDTHGHAAGDAVLHAVAQCLQQTLRDSDMIGRVGGEEFSIFLPNTGCQGALELAERIRAAIEALQVQLESHICLHVTVSLGVSISQDSSLDILGIQREADKAMYQAKTGGRNRVSLFSRDTHTTSSKG